MDIAITEAIRLMDDHSRQLFTLWCAKETLSYFPDYDEELSRFVFTLQEYVDGNTSMESAGCALYDIEGYFMYSIEWDSWKTVLGTVILGSEESHIWAAERAAEDMIAAARDQAYEEELDRSGGNKYLATNAYDRAEEDAVTYQAKKLVELIKDAEAKERG